MLQSKQADPEMGAVQSGGWKEDTIAVAGTYPHGSSIQQPSLGVVETVLCLFRRIIGRFAWRVDDLETGRW